MSIIAYVAAIFVLNGEAKSVRLDVPTVAQCVTETVVVQEVLKQLGADGVSARCIIEVVR